MEPLYTAITNKSNLTLLIFSDHIEHGTLLHGKNLIFKFYPNDTVLSAIDFKGLAMDGKREIRVSSQAYVLWAEIALYMNPDGSLWYIGQVERTPEIDAQKLDYHIPVKSEVSSRMNAVVSLSMKLELHLEKFKICPAQCKYLVQTFLKGFQGMEESYIAVFRSEFNIVRLHQCNKLPDLVKCLASLEDFLRYTDNFLSECGKEWRYFSLELSVPSSPSTTRSKFDLLIRELSWNLDKIRYALCMEEGLSRVKWKWSSKRCRHVLIEVGEDPDHEDDIGGSSARVDDRVNLKDLVGDASLFEEKMPRMSILERAMREPATREAFRLILRKRMSSGISVPSTDQCRSIFRIDYRTLKLTNIIGRGGFKEIHKGKWLGQDVAIARMEGYKPSDLKKEAEYLLELQHPNIVEFYGWSYEPASRWGTEAGYLVMGLMERDLFNEIERHARPRGPFSISIALDILLQIVEAMVYLHEREIMHRDLKTKNCLVKARSAPPDGYYTVKLTDFGSATREFISDNLTTNRGTSKWMAPEMLAPPGSCLKIKYTKSVDVYGFAMTCYHVITGFAPFSFSEISEQRNVAEAIATGNVRPAFPKRFTCPEDLKQLIIECWDAKADSRPDFMDVRERLWNIRRDIETRIGGALGDPDMDDLEQSDYKALERELYARMESVSSLSRKLYSYLGKFKICPAQCEHVVETFSKDIEEMRVNSMIESNIIRRLYNSKELSNLVICLASLEIFLHYADKVLSEYWGMEWKRAALEFSVTLRSPKTTTLSKFDHLIRELRWNLDKIRYTLSLGGELSRVEWKWSSKRCRHVLIEVGGDLDREADDGSDLAKRDSDQDNLRCGLEDGSIVPKRFGSSDLEVFVAVLKQRLCVVPSIHSRNFRIYHLNLKYKAALSFGAFKTIYSAEWLGQEVAIAIIYGADSQELVEREAGYLVELQHPNIVAFYGYSYTDDPISQASFTRINESPPGAAGCLVMELMEGDLRTIMNRMTSRVPFPIPVALDILLQIAEAMVHLHELDILHRELKPSNCLLKARPAPRSTNSEVLYDVKLCGFTSAERHVNSVYSTPNPVSPRWMAPEVIRQCTQSLERSLYTKSRDVYSFAIIGYQVVTGVEIPFTASPRPFLASLRCPEGLKQLIIDCCHEERGSRPTFIDIRERLWTIRTNVELQAY